MAETKAQILTAIEQNIGLVPQHMRQGARSYILHGREVGGFLTALFEMDHVRAQAVADHINSANWQNWLDFMLKGMPTRAFGSPLKVAAWQKMRGLDGYPDIAL